MKQELTKLDMARLIVSYIWNMAHVCTETDKARYEEALSISKKLHKEELLNLLDISKKGLEKRDIEFIDWSNQL